MFQRKARNRAHSYQGIDNAIRAGVAKKIKGESVHSAQAEGQVVKMMHIFIINESTNSSVIVIQALAEEE